MFSKENFTNKIFGYNTIVFEGSTQERGVITIKLFNKLEDRDMYERTIAIDGGMFFDNVVEITHNLNFLTKKYSRNNCSFNHLCAEVTEMLDFYEE